MASIGTADEKLRFTLNVLSELSRQGFVSDGPVGMNSELGMVRLLFHQTLDDRVWLDTEIMVFTEALYSWINSVERIVLEGSKNSYTGFDNLACPHLLLNVRRRELTTYKSQGKEPQETQIASYEFFAGLASTYLLGKGGDWDAGLGLWLELDGDALLAFVRALQAELDVVSSST